MSRMISCLQNDQERLHQQTDPYKELASAIVLRAVTDYTEILGALLQYEIPCTKRRLATRHMLEIEQFFYSSWYDLLCNIEPEVLLQGCNRIVRSKYAMPLVALKAKNRNNHFKKETITK